MAKQAALNEVRPVLEATDKALDKIEGFLDGLDKVTDKGADVVEAGLEKVADIVPEALDTSVHVTTEGTRKVLRFFRSPKHAAAAVVIAASLAGAGLGVAGYFLTVKRVKAKMQAEFDDRLESEIAEMRRFYARRNKDGEFSTPQSAVEALLTEDAAKALKSYRGAGDEPQNIEITGEPEVHAEPTLTAEQRAEALRTAGYTEAQIEEVLEHATHTTVNVAKGASPEELEALREKLRGGPVEVERTTNNIFVDGHAIEDFDYEAEVAQRTPDEPYVITHDEFMENTNDWETSTITYYNGDDVLADERDVPMPDDVVGPENLAKFGYGSKDSRIVYVCNEKIETLFEIALSDGKYSEEVAGLRHSAPLRRFRRSDDE